MQKGDLEGKPPYWEHPDPPELGGRWEEGRVGGGELYQIYLLQDPLLIYLLPPGRSLGLLISYDILAQKWALAPPSAPLARLDQG